jgi:nucleotide-binding universal stress UspA family protein
MLYRTVLCATDGLEHSEQALQQAGVIASATGADLHVAHIPQPVLREAYVRLSADRQEAKLLREITRLILNDGVKVISHVVSAGYGSVAVQIARLADEVDADVIVVGGRRHGTLASLLVGSVTLALPRLTDRPVLIVPGRAAGRLEPGQSGGHHEAGLAGVGAGFC